MEEWITVKEAAELLNISRRQVINRIQSGQLKAMRDGRMWLIHSSLSAEIEEVEELPKGYSKETYEKLEEMVNYLKQQIEEKDKQIEKLQEQLERANEALAEASHRHDTVVMQMTRLLEYHQQPFWRKLLFRKALPSPIDKTILDMETDESKGKQEK